MNAAVSHSSSQPSTDHYSGDKKPARQPAKKQQSQKSGSKFVVVKRDKIETANGSRF
jgi:hypothetical protein